MHCFTLVLQVCIHLYVFQLSVKVSNSLMVNGTLGQSVVLPSGVDEKTYNSVNPDIVQWERNREYIIQFFNQVKSLESNDFKGRLTVSPTDGSLTVSPLRGEDEGEYVFSGTGSGSFPQHRVTLRVYEKIRAVEIHHEKSYGAENTSCNLTLHCNVTGGTDVKVHWLRDGSKNPEQLGSAAVNLVLRPTDGDLTYTCVASNPVSSRSATVHSDKCYTQQDPNLVIYIAAAAGGGVLLLVLLLLICCVMKKKNKKVEEDAPTTLYAEIDRQNTIKKEASERQNDLTSLYDVVKDRKQANAQTLYDTVHFQRTKGTSQYQEII